TWEVMGPSVKAQFDIVIGAVKMLAGILNFDGKTMWDGFVDLAVGAAKLVVGAIMGVLIMAAKALDALNKLNPLSGPSHFADDAELVRKEWLASLNDKNTIGG